jgi:lysozyme
MILADKVWKLFKKMIAADEGLRLKPYLDTVGKLTIGYGRNLDDVGISLSEADILLSNDTQRTYKFLIENHSWFNFLSHERQAAIMDFCYNLGEKGFSDFKRSIEALKAGKFEDAAIFMMQSKWAHQVPNRALRVTRVIQTNSMDAYDKVSANSK